MKVAIVHYWLVKMRGGENVVEALCELFPDADVFTHVYSPKDISDAINSHKVTTSFIQSLPFSLKLYRSYLPFMPLALKHFDLSGYDLVISSESGPAKGINTYECARHICYCHTPMRYVWDMYDEYKSSAKIFTRIIMPFLVWWLRKWDKRTSEGVDQFVANSRFVQERIKNIYDKKSAVVYPPVSVDRFDLSANVGDYYLYAGELTHYKMPQLAIEAFNKSGRKLIVIGDGPLEDDLRSVANSNIQFIGRQPFDQLRIYFSQCRALIFPGIEDFGIVPVEVMASGRPVIAFRDGGALETVSEFETGLFFDEQNEEALNRAVDQFELCEKMFVPLAIKQHADKFSKQRFISEMSELIALQTSIGKKSCNHLG